MQKFIDSTRNNENMPSPVVTPMRSLLFAAAVLLITSASGCGAPEEKVAEPTASVAGTVTLAGKTMPRGTIHLYSLVTGADGKGEIDSKGNFKLESPLAPGEYAVFLSGVSGIPEKFLSETSSDQRVTVANGDNALTIDLK